MRSKGIYPLILNLSMDRGEWSTSSPGCFTLGKQLTEPQLSGPHSLGGCFEGHKNIWLLPGIKSRTVQLTDHDIPALMNAKIFEGLYELKLSTVRTSILKSSAATHN
jgi:hypothetical protein